MAAKVELRTRVKGLLTDKPTVVLDVLLLPRGSGNRKRARELAALLRSNDLMGPHIDRVVCGASRVTVHVKATVASMRALNQWLERERLKKENDVEGQPPLFA